VIHDHLRYHAAMTPLILQRVIALPYLLLGGWCLVAPHMVEALMFTPAYQHLSATSALMIGCFGAQAVLGGLFIWFSEWTAKTFLVYAIALLPFFWFNYWFVYEVPIFNRWMALDFVSNAAMLGLSLLGWRLMRQMPQATIIPRI
jgi:hypothetical protein